jgi:hypothetical protein
MHSILSYLRYQGLDSSSFKGYYILRKGKQSFKSLTYTLARSKDAGIKCK